MKKRYVRTEILAWIEENFALLSQMFQEIKEIGIPEAKMRPHKVELEKLIRAKCRYSSTIASRRDDIVRHMNAIREIENICEWLMDGSSHNQTLSIPPKKCV